MDLQISGKKALMAGGSAGMGRATAERLAEAGVDLFISARRAERLNSAADAMAKKYAISVTPIVADSSTCLLYTSPSPRDVEESRMPSSA